MELDICSKCGVLRLRGSSVACPVCGNATSVLCKIHVKMGRLNGVRIL